MLPDASMYRRPSLLDSVHGSDLRNGSSSDFVTLLASFQAQFLCSFIDRVFNAVSALILNDFEQIVERFLVQILILLE